RDHGSVVGLAHIESHQVFQLGATQPKPLDIRLGLLPAREVASAERETPTHHQRNGREVVVAAEAHLLSLEAIVSGQRYAGDVRRRGQTDTGLRSADSGTGLPQLLPPG